MKVRKNSLIQQVQVSINPSLHVILVFKTLKLLREFGLVLDNTKDKTDEDFLVIWQRVKP